MKSQRALTERAELFVATATIAAHATYSESGFRQRDVRFYIELFSNWVELSFEKYSLNVQNTQLLRYLDGLVESSLAKRISKKSPPLYRLTRAGFVDLISRVVNRSYISQPEHFFFLQYFLKNYRELLLTLVASAGPEFTNIDRVEIDSLLDTKKLIQKELEEVRKGIERQKIRIADANSTAQHVTKATRQDKPLATIVKEVEKAYPYELNSQKPLSELIGQIPENQKLWELTQGNQARVKEIWSPAQELLELYEGLLKRLI